MCLRAGGCGGGGARLICVHVSVVIFIPSIDHRRADIRVDKLVSSLRQQPHLAFVHAGILRPLLDLTLPGFSGKGKDRAIQLASAIEGRGCRGRKGRPHPNPTESIDGMDPNTRPPTAVDRVQAQAPIDRMGAAWIETAGAWALGVSKPVRFSSLTHPHTQNHYPHSARSIDRPRRCSTRADHEPLRACCSRWCWRPPC